MQRQLMCDCRGWYDNMGLINEIFVFAHTHNIHYKGDVFVYCPWCGKLLEGREKYAETNRVSQLSQAES